MGVKYKTQRNPRPVREQKSLLLSEQLFSIINSRKTINFFYSHRMLEKMMTAVALLVVLVTMFATFSRAEEKCAGGHINQNLCQKTCNFNKCTCDMVDTTSFSSCSQKCHILSSCPAMDCSGNQTLFSQAKWNLLTISIHS